jgi:hypothetical protein
MNKKTNGRLQLDKNRVSKGSFKHLKVSLDTTINEFGDININNIILIKGGIEYKLSDIATKDNFIHLKYLSKIFNENHINLRRRQFILTSKKYTINGAKGGLFINPIAFINFLIVKNINWNNKRLIKILDKILLHGLKNYLNNHKIKITIRDKNINVKEIELLEDNEKDETIGDKN